MHLPPVVIYISGPIDEVVNALHMANVLWDDGFACFIPHIYYHQKLSSSSSIDNWLKQNLVFLRKCDLVLSLKGETDETIKEVEFAKDHDIPVFSDYRKLMVYIREGDDDRT